MRPNLNLNYPPDYEYVGFGAQALGRHLTTAKQMKKFRYERLEAVFLRMRILLLPANIP